MCFVKKRNQSVRHELMKNYEQNTTLFIINKYFCFNKTEQSVLLSLVINLFLVVFLNWCG